MKLSSIPISKLFKYFYLILSIVCFLIFIFITLFLYKNFYKTITQAEEVVILQKEVAIEDIDIDHFETIVEKLKEKMEKRSIKLNLNF